MVSPNKVIIVFVLLSFLLTPVLADQEYADISCEDCVLYFGEYGYCSTTNTCMVNDQPQTQQSTQTATTTPPAQTTTASEEDISELKTITQDLQQRITALENDYILIQNQITQLSQGNVAEEQISGLKQDLTSIATGLAGLQESTSRTLTELRTVETNLEEKDSLNKILTIIFIVLLIIAIALAVIYFVTRQRKVQQSPGSVSSEVKEYITHQIKQGKKYPSIRESLLNAGWREEDIKFAYSETMKHNYRKFLQTSPTAQGKKLNPQNKILIIILLSILLLVGGFFILKTITGKAIQFNTGEELSIEVKEKLQEKIADNQFYPLVSEIDLCVEVIDGVKAVSYIVEKTITSVDINPAAEACSRDPAHDVSLKFNSWDSFKDMIEDPSCKNLRDSYAQPAGFSILPSRFFLPGVKKNPTLDYKSLCPVLNTCLTPVERAFFGC